MKFLQWRRTAECTWKGELHSHFGLILESSGEAQWWRRWTVALTGIAQCRRTRPITQRHRGRQRGGDLREGLDRGGLRGCARAGLTSLTLYWLRTGRIEASPLYTLSLVNILLDYALKV